MRKKSNLPDMQGKRIQADESGAVPSTQRFYHIEYFLLPDDLVPRQVNLGLFGVAAQLFTESGSKVKYSIKLSNPKCHVQKVGERFQIGSDAVAQCFNSCLGLICTHRYRTNIKDRT